MKNLIATCLMFSIVISCQNNNKITNSSSSENSIKNQQKINSDTLRPSDQFIKLVKFIDSCNYTWDTTRIKTVSHYAIRKKYKKIDNYLFYRMAPAESDIVIYYNTYKDYKTIIVDIGGNDSNKVNTIKIDSNDLDGPIKKGLVKIQLFNNPKAIWGYFYINRTEKDLITDGFIEQWEFSTSIEATNAYNEINKVKSYIFFNTESYCYLNDRNLYFFHCRAMAFSFQLKKFYEYLKELEN